MTNETKSDLDPLDRIEKSTMIEASAATVFALVSRPGWWINDGDVDPDPDVRDTGGLSVVTHPKHGEFRFETVGSRPPTYVAFRWHHRLPEDGKRRSTLVEFHIEDQGHGKVRLRVVESGFSLLQKPREQWLADRADNDRGWDAELDAARRHVTAP